MIRIKFFCLCNVINILITFLNVALLETVAIENKNAIYSTSFDLTYRSQTMFSYIVFPILMLHLIHHLKLNHSNSFTIISLFSHSF